MGWEVGRDGVVAGFIGWLGGWMVHGWVGL